MLDIDTIGSRAGPLSAVEQPGAKGGGGPMLYFTLSAGSFSGQSNLPGPDPLYQCFSCIRSQCRNLLITFYVAKEQN